MCGVLPLLYFLGFKYFITLIDDYLRVTWVYLLKSKSDVFSTFVSFQKMAETQFNKKIKILCSDNRGEYVFHTFSSFFGLVGNCSSNQLPRHSKAKRDYKKKKTDTCLKFHVHYSLQ